MERTVINIEASPETSLPDKQATAVEITDVSKRFGGNLAVGNISLSIREGEFFSFLGPSGCGKTTLLRMIAGFEHPTAGKISISGADMKDVPPHKRPVNMVFQNYALFPHLTIAENVAFGLKSKRQYTNSEIDQKVNESLELVRLSQFGSRLPSQISGGQAQRAALARAVVNNPAVLLLDEPLSALDPQIREEMQVELARLQKRLGMTFIMVTHDQDEALALSTRIAVFRQGNLEQVATPEEIYKNPKTLFVAKFIGQTNVIEGTITSITANLCNAVTDAGIEFRAVARDSSLAAGSKVAVLIKPHDIRWVDASEATSLNRAIYDVQILNQSFQGNSTEYLISIGERVELRLTSANGGSRSNGPHSPARVAIDAEDCELLRL